MRKRGTYIGLPSQSHVVLVHQSASMTQGGQKMMVRQRRSGMGTRDKGRALGLGYLKPC
jgi:hypothetical protein